MELSGRLPARLATGEAYGVVAPLRAERRAVRGELSRLRERLPDPNLAKFQQLVGRETTSEQEIDEVGRGFNGQGCCSVLLVSLGVGGALLHGRGTEHLRTPTVPIHRKVGRATARWPGSC